MAEPVGTLRVAVEGDTAVLSDDLDRAYRLGEKFGQSIRGAFQGAIGAVHEFLGALGPLGDVLTGVGIGRFLQHSMELADRLDDTAKRLNVNVEAFQAYQVAALESGIKTAALERGLNRLTDQVGNALQNNKAAIESFQKLGVAVTNVDGSTRATDQILRDVVKSLAAMEDQTKAAAIANDLLGRGGSQLAIALREAATDTDAYVAKLKEAGLVLDEEVIKKAGEAADKMELAGRAFQMVGVSIMANVSPAIIYLMGLVDEAIKGIVEMARVFGLLAPDADELARRLGEIGDEIKTQQQLAAYGNVGAAQYVEVLQRQRDALREQLRQVMALQAAENKLRADRQVVEPGAPLAFVPKAKEPKDDSKALDREYRAHQKAIEDAIRLEDKLRAYEQKLDDDKQKRVEDGIKLEDKLRAYEQKGADETARRYEEGIRLEDRLRAYQQQKLMEQVAAEQKAADMDEEIQRQADEAANKGRLAAYEREQAALDKQLQPVRDIFDSIDRAITTSVTGVILGTETMGQAFAKLGQSIGISLLEKGLNLALDQMEKAIIDFLKSEAIQNFIQFAVKFLGGLLGGVGGGGDINVAQTTNIGWDQELASGGIVQSPTVALIGERGPEAVVPLSGGGLASGPMVQVNIVNQHPGAEVRQQSRRSSNGMEIHDIVIHELRRMVGNGEMESVMSPYSLRRQPTGR